MKTNIKYIPEGSSSKEIIESVNLNFDQILYSGIGYAGDRGPVGPIGPTGQVGNPGSSGVTGQRASRWFRQNSPPSHSESLRYDYWINTSPGPNGSDSIYYYDGNSWINTGEALIKGSIFSLYQQTIGPAGTTGQNSIYNSLDSDPQYNTLVIGDYQFDASNVNPNFSKLRLSLKGDSILPILSFSKLNFVDPQPPSFYWRNNSDDTDHSLVFKGSGSLSIRPKEGIQIRAGLTGTTSVGNGQLNVESGPLSVISSGNGSFYAGGTADNGVSTIFSTSQTFSLSTSNVDINPTRSLFKRGLNLNYTGLTGSSDPRLNVFGPLPSVTSMGFFETSTSPNSNFIDSLLSTIAFNSTTPSTMDYPIDDFRLNTQDRGAGVFRTSLVGTRRYGAMPGESFPFVKIGKAGVTGAFNNYSVKNVSGVYSDVTISGSTVSQIDLSSVSNYTDQWINITTYNGSIPSGGGVWVRIPSPDNSLGVSGLYSNSESITYRFFYNGNLSGSSTEVSRDISDNNFGGIIYSGTNPSGGSQLFKADFCNYTKTFELTFYARSRRIFWKTYNCCGVVDPYSLTSLSPSDSGLSL